MIANVLPRFYESQCIMRWTLHSLSLRYTL